MPTTTGREVIADALGALGIYAPGEAVSADNNDVGFRRLNNMLSAWATQSLTIPVVVREIFPLTANLGVYTIGPGGDFDTTRPPSQASLTGAGLLLNSDSTTDSVSVLTGSGNVATATVTSHGYADGQNVTIEGATPAAYNGTFPIDVTGVNTFTYVFPGGVSPATGTITALLESNATDVVEIPRAIITDDAWQAIQIKSLTSTLFTCLYYNPTFAGGLGTIHLWPIPTTGDNSLVLYRRQQLTSFVSLDATYDIAEGYAEALGYNLALRMASPFGVSISDDVREMAGLSLGTIKRANVKLTDLPTDPALTHSRRGGYNIQTGNY